MQSKRMFMSAVLLTGFTLIHCHTESSPAEVASKTGALTADVSETDDANASESDLKKRVPPPPLPPASPPPVEAFTACAAQAEGDACTFTKSEDEIAGTCRSVPNGETELACAPTNQPAPPPPPPPPPVEAFTACASKVSGDVCSFTHRDREIAGTCRSGPKDGSKLACAPTNQPAPPPPPPPPPAEAFTACASKVSGDVCSFTHREREIAGTCRSGPKDGSKLACAPADQPPPPPPPTEES